MTNGLASQGSSNAKIINYAIPGLQIYLCFINIMETKENKNIFVSTVTSHEYQKISYHWQQPIQVNTKENSKAPHYWFLILWGETTSDQWNLHTKGKQCEKHSSCNPSISGLYVLKRPFTHNSENIWASWNSVSLATLLFVQQRIQEKCKKA